VEGFPGWVDSNLVFAEARNIGTAVLREEALTTEPALAEAGAVSTRIDFRPRRFPVRTLDERFALRFPKAFRLAVKLGARLPVRSRIRRYFVVRRTAQGYQAVNRGDLDLLLAVYHPDVVTSFDPSHGLIPPDLAGEHAGDAGFRRLWDSWRSAWQDLRLEPQEVIDAGDRMVVRVRVTGRGRGSGLPATMTYFEVYTLREGRIARTRELLRRRRRATGGSSGALADQQVTSRLNPAPSAFVPFLFRSTTRTTFAPGVYVVRKP
jgi:ketosteroid isomerase-like protein